MDFPIKKYDHLNRMIYVDWNGIERCINIFWDDTDKIKIKYRLWNNETEVEAYDLKGNVVFKRSTGVMVVDFPRLKMKNNKMFYIVDKKKIDEWLQKLDYQKKIV